MNEERSITWWRQEARHCVTASTVSKRSWPWVQTGPTRRKDTSTTTALILISDLRYNARSLRRLGLGSSPSLSIGTVSCFGEWSPVIGRGDSRNSDAYIEETSIRFCNYFQTSHRKWNLIMNRTSYSNICWNIENVSKINLIFEDKFNFLFILCKNISVQSIKFEITVIKTRFP